MTYFITGATGFIGKRLAKNLMLRKGTIYVLMRDIDPAKVDALRAFIGDDGTRVKPIKGDISKTGLGISAADRKCSTAKSSTSFTSLRSMIWGLTRNRRWRSTLKGPHIPLRLRT